MSQPTIREQTIMHCVRCANAATAQRDQDYWKELASETYDRYVAGGGKRLQLTKGTVWSMKVDDPGWLTPEEIRAKQAIPAARAQEIVDAERDRDHAAALYLAALNRRQG